MDFNWDKTHVQPMQEPSVEHVDESNWEYVDEFVEHTFDENPTVNEAIKRIEQAKLYESLLKHDFFAPGSAREEIQTKVTSEIRDFILERLTILVGIKAEPSFTQVRAELPWNDVQIEALTSVANRLLKNNSNQGPVQPVVQPYSGGQRSPQVQMARPAPSQQPQPQRSQQKQAPKSKVAPAPAGRPNLPSDVKIDPSTGNPVSENGIVLYGGQVQNKRKPPQKMPRQAEMDMINANQVQRSQQGQSLGDKMLGIAITNAQNTNRHIIEDNQ